MFSLVVLLCCLVLLHKWYNVIKKQNEIRKYLISVPGPPRKQFIGNMFDFGRNSVDVFKNLSTIDNIYGPITKVFFGPTTTNLIVSDPDLVELITKSTKNLKKSKDYYLIRPWLMNGLILSNGSYWQKRRKVITPTFHFKILEDFIAVFNNESDILVSKLMKENGKAACDLYPYVSAFTLDSICETAMGTPVYAQKQPDNEYVRAVQSMCGLYVKRKFCFWKKFNWLFRFSNDFKEQTEAVNTICDFTKSVIERRRQELLQRDQVNSTGIEVTDTAGVRNRTAFLNLLLQSTVDGKPLSNDDILEEVNTFMFAGHDTTASTISFVLYTIARYPDIQDKILVELNNIPNNSGTGKPTMQDLNEMKYLERVIKETLRLYPAIPYISRELTHDMEYKNLLLRKGLMTTIFIFNLHRRPELFDNPEKFDPDRFLVDENETKHHFSYIPFSAGPRNCIGQKFAMYEMKSALSNIVRNFKLFPADPRYDVILTAEVTLKSTNGMSVRLEQRNT